MPSVIHEILLQTLREEGVLAELLTRARGLKIGAVAPADPNFSEVKSTEWHGDALFVGGDQTNPEQWLVVELQASVDEKKLRTIPLSLELARDRYRAVPGDVVLVTVGENVARWFDRHPFVYRGPLGTERRLAVVRIDLSRIPVERLFDERRPSLALLAVAAHAKDPSPKAKQVAARALGVARRGSVMTASIVDAIFQMIDVKLRRELEEVMKQEGYRTDWLQESYLKGRADGKDDGKEEWKAQGRVEEVRAVLVRLLTKRGLSVNAEQKARIEAERDVRRLERWFDAGIAATSATEVFSEDA